MGRVWIYFAIGRFKCLFIGPKTNVRITYSKDWFTVGSFLDVDVEFVF